ncbi:HNH endonuclease [Vibrio variabilis]|uniref:HNH endonuclease n=1 Tax=Vibrio variabilis TaxID=990271 RepID=UPI003B82E74E
MCNINFGEVYGDIGAGFIHVHHVTPLSKIKQEYTVDPVKDLVPVCPNCHAMLHQKVPPYTISELQKIIAK